MHLSHSGLQQLLTCPASYFLSKKQGISLKKESAALSIGSAFHWGCEHNSADLTGYLSQIDPYITTLNDFHKDLALATGMISAYLQKKELIFNKILTDYDGISKLQLLEEYHEVDITTNLPSYKFGKPHEFHGIIDLLLLTNKGWIVIDYKTSSQTPDFDKYLDQVLRYCWMLKQEFPEVPVYKIGIINVRKIAIRQKEKENNENFVMRITREYTINDNELVVYHQFDPDDFEENKMNLYIENLSRMADFAQTIEDNNLWFINYGNAVSVYGKSEFWNLFYKTQNCHYLYKIKDPMFNPDFNEISDYRDCNELDIDCLKIPNLINHFSDFENFVFNEVNPDTPYTKDAILKELQIKYTIDLTLFERYWIELNRKLDAGEYEAENVST